MINKLPLSNIKVLEMAGLAPVPFCGLILADFGATVIRVDRVVGESAVGQGIDQLTRGKQSIAINLKEKSGVDLLRDLAKKSDVIIDSYRPGVMEKLGLSPDRLLSDAPHLIYARLTGYGQTGPYANMAGHDINYIALSGVLSMLGRHKELPLFPSNLLGDFAAGGMMCALGIVMALFERTRTGLGKIIDSSMMDGASYLASFIFRLKADTEIGLWDKERGMNMLDTGAHFYEVYRTKDGKFISVGAIEPQFYQQLIKGLGLDGRDDLPPQLDAESWPSMKKLFTEIFLTKTRDEWENIFMGTDACVAPVLESEEISKHPHSQARNLIISGNETNDNTGYVNSAPRLFDPVHLNNETFSKQQQNSMNSLSKKIKGASLVAGGNSINILKYYGYKPNQIDQLMNKKIVIQSNSSKL